MKFKFKIQDYQTEAVESVVNVFAGQNFNDKFIYRRDMPVENDADNFKIYDEELYTGFANNFVNLSREQLASNVKKIQEDNEIPLAKDIKSELGFCSLDVEMETGTGKTYVYIKTMFELNRRYGWSKFIVVVPSTAIREGVRKSFETMENHFMEHYGKKAHFFVYDSKRLNDIDSFSHDSDINVMIINTQAFNSSFEEDKKNSVARIIFSERDDFGSRRPIDVIAANNPIIIMDEPQKMGGEKTRNALKKFNPLFCLNYSATHKQHHTLVYALDAFDAFEKRLVKKIKVTGIDIKNLPGTNSYMYLNDIILSATKPPTAHLEFEINHKNSIKRETRLINVDDDLFILSKNMEQYRGYRVNEIDPIKNFISFTNGKKIYTREVYGDISEKELRRLQIRETIRAHFEKEKNLFERGIKCLSLFFIDEVAKYRKYDEDGKEINSEYGEIFEEEYNNILNEYRTLLNTPYDKYLQSIETHKTHSGYFSIDKKGRKVDSTLKRGSDESDDISAYDLILKDKERLLSFENPVRFIFSHSALREGWDNPNVFQICTLKKGGNSYTQKRQEVGRGLRLCVNQKGDRMDETALNNLVQDVNILTVIASDGYKDFVADLQKEIYEDLRERPLKASENYFIGKKVSINGENFVISEEQGKKIYRYLIKNDYIDDDDNITDKYRFDKENNSLAPLPENCVEISEGVYKLIQGIFDPSVLNEMIDDGKKTKIHENKLNDNFYKKEFQKLWSLINHKYAYTVEFDSDELISKAVAHINEKMFVTKLQYIVTTGEQISATDFQANSNKTRSIKHIEGSSIKYDLIGKISEGTKLTRQTVAKILSKIEPATFAMFQANPEEFIAKSIRLINEQKAAMVIEDITYNTTDGTFDTAIFTAEKHIDISKAYRSKKNIQDYVFTDGYAKDGKSVELRMAEDLDIANEVEMYAKLPRGFYIPTPVGNYSPDWAIVFNKGTVKHIFFIAETKGTMETMNLRPFEQDKIKCAKKLFATLSNEDVVYHEVDSYQNLMNIIENL